ncbi:hypothetical protein ASG49_01990 [Marmoricola sp. Leaf446]|uniref:LmeA family phospholipid-binding protein n=1 Tax=Marmoricola sp. Leaf446 TaxID=1736379 RepID=UPI0006F7029F|nr:DUF2993 domain-containing protein [Marmoricola sp. Leaf446]KQT93775.1 hypothetical protein ASG49_01990 [Marmoricola sp. Leaf446]
MRTLLWTLVVLALLAVGADRGADWWAEREAATRLAAAQDLGATPDVDIAGFPFLTQALAREFGEVSATGDDVVVRSADGELRLARLRVTFTDVTTDRDLSRFAAQRGRAVATISYAELGRLTGLDVTYVGEGRVRGSREVTVAGQRFDPGVTVRPRLTEGAVRFVDAAAEGSLPPAVTAVVQAAFDVDLPVGALPYDVRPESLSATASGLRLVLVGRDLSFAG